LKLFTEHYYDTLQSQK